MNKTSAKNKMVMLVIGWVVLSLAMFFYFFGFLDASNQQIVNSMEQQKKDLSALQDQEKSFELAKADLDKLAAEPIQPDDFFSKDITLVNEIQILEGWNEKLNVNMQLSGLSGTIATASKANTVTPIAQIPYTISIKGSLAQITAFLQVLENLSFVTDVTNITVAAGDKNTVSASLTAFFYLKE